MNYRKKRHIGELSRSCRELHRFVSASERQCLTPLFYLASDLGREPTEVDTTWAEAMIARLQERGERDPEARWRSICRRWNALAGRSTGMTLQTLRYAPGAREIRAQAWAALGPRIDAAIEAHVVRHAVTKEAQKTSRSLLRFAALSNYRNGLPHESLTDLISDAAIGALCEPLRMIDASTKRAHRNSDLHLSQTFKRDPTVAAVLDELKRVAQDGGAVAAVDTLIGVNRLVRHFASLPHATTMRLRRFSDDGVIDRLVDACIDDLFALAQTRCAWTGANRAGTALIVLVLLETVEQPSKVRLCTFDDYLHCHSDVGRRRLSEGLEADLSEHLLALVDLFHRDVTARFGRAPLFLAQDFRRPHTAITVAPRSRTALERGVAAIGRRIDCPLRLGDLQTLGILWLIAKGVPLELVGAAAGLKVTSLRARYRHKQDRDAAKRLDAMLDQVEHYDAA